MLDRLSPRPGARRPHKRVGRGPGSGTGKTAGRGVKGQGKRSPGRETPLWFEGGQMPLARRLPKRGFYSRHRKVFEVVNLAALAELGAGTEVTPEFLRERGLVGKGTAPVKLLGSGDAPAKLRITVHAASASARQKVESAGGTVEIIA
jgi:large subunit ribosomal protein L15